MFLTLNPTKNNSSTLWLIGLINLLILSLVTEALLNRQNLKYAWMEYPINLLIIL